MEEFKGMSRDTVRVKTPTAMWEFARNILLSKGWTSVSNEYGFLAKTPIPGVLLGVISTNEETVIFSKDGAFSCIGITKVGEEDTYIPKLRSIYLDFARPIEGIFVYNYLKELIVVFSDGVYENSTDPKLINLTTIGESLDINLELLDPTFLDVLKLFNNTQEGQIAIKYGADTAIAIDIVYITYAYVLEDDLSTTSHYPVHHIAYPVYYWEEKKKRTISLSFTELDPRYSKIKIGLVVSFEGALIGYESAAIVYNNTGTLEYEILTLSSFKSISVDQLVVPSIYYNRIKSMTTQNNQVVVGHLATDDEKEVQKYINRLTLGLRYMTKQQDKYTHPTLCPDEVYSFYIELQGLSGQYGKAYPLIGPEPRLSNERDPLTAPDLVDMGLNAIPLGYKRFHIINSGGFIIPAPYDENAISLAYETEMDFGFWENEETYPNTDEYNSSIDYDGGALGGVDLRNTPIKYHRIPGLDAISDKIPVLLGKTNNTINNDQVYNGDKSKFYGLIPKFGVYVKNFETVIPASLKNKIQGFRILAVKRKTGDRLVEDINTLHRIINNVQEIDGIDVELLAVSFGSPNTGTGGYKSVQFGYSKVESITLSNFKTAITPTIIKANYAVGHFRNTVLGDNAVKPEDVGTFNQDFYFKISEEQKYAEFKTLEYLPANNTVAKTYLEEDVILLKAKNYLAVDLAGGGGPAIDERWNPLLVQNDTGPTPDRVYIPSIRQFNNTTRLYETITDYGKAAGTETAYRIAISSTFLNLQKNLYQGFNPTDFFVIGRVSTSLANVNINTILSDNGDIFTNNIIRRPISYFIGTEILGRVKYKDLYIKGAWGIVNNSSSIIAKDRKFEYEYPLTGGSSESATVKTFIFTPTIFNEEVQRSLNDYIVSTPINSPIPTIGYFPYRVARTPKIPNENLQTNNLRTFRANDYYEMLNNRGEVIAVRGTNKQLFIQQKSSLFVATLKDKLNTDGSTTYLGEGDIFDRSPDEIKYNTDKGYIGCTSQYACIVTPDGYVTVDQIKGNIFIIGSDFMEITKMNMTNWFEENWDTKDYYWIDRFGQKQRVDNPFYSTGHLVGYDEKFNRLLVTKKYYRFLFPEGVGTIYSFNGEFYSDSLNNILNFNNPNYFEELSKTFSFDLRSKTFVSEHDYYPNVYYFNNTGLFAINNDNALINEPIDLLLPFQSIYKMYKFNNIGGQNGKYFNGLVYESYVDVIFNSRLDLSKMYQAITWESLVETVNGARLFHKTIDKVMVYSDYQCSGEIDVTEFNTSRNVEGVWNFNEFRDLVVDANSPIVREEGRVVLSNINKDKSYFEKSIFIGTFVVVRLIMKNADTNNVYINCVNVKSRISNR